MASKATITLMLLGKLGQRSLAAPAGDNMVESSSSVNSLIKASQHSFPIDRSSLKQPRTTMIQAYDVESLLLSPLYSPPFSTTTPADRSTNPFFSFSYSKSQTSTQSVTAGEKTVTVTKEIPTTITLSANPVTVTEILFPPPPTSTSNSPSRTSTAGLGPAKRIWLAPTDLSDLSAFRVSKFTGGQENLEFVNSVPADAKRPDEVASSEDRDNNTATSTALLQFLFPAGSIDPAKKPQGGAEFYASPIDITNARNVTLQYSAFFPLDFDFVLAGKMPGLYGGHTGCSGGDAASDCFSTRLMWRQGGAGELYLYAPKNKQSDKLCKAQGSVCDDMYGFSIGRGSFFWKTGNWTTIKQTVFLNTPGKQDGVFMLDVDGKRAISRSDILYRDEKGGGKGKDGKQKTKTKHTKTTTTTTTALETPTSPSDDDGDLLGLGPLLSGLLGGRRREMDPIEKSDDDDGTTTAAGEIEPRSTSPFPEVVAMTPVPTRTILERSQESEVRFDGIFFSTFFGGHDDKYATPKDQYVWFKDFGLAYNS